jgi:hypothetical protein|tara:strand:- start:935 stop:1063 length:129 start_codon:yes stop_codon:yes gene_type:complete
MGKKKNFLYAAGYLIFSCHAQWVADKWISGSESFSTEPSTIQ